MAAGAVKDRFANIAYGIVTMSAANTLTFSQILMGISPLQRLAMLVHRIQYNFPSATIREVAAVTDELRVALTTSNRLTDISDVSEPAILDMLRITGAGVNVEPWILPILSDLTGLPGGGKLTPGNPLYLAMATSGFAAAGVCRVQIDFTLMELTDADFLELVQAMYPANIA
jgi:hypothetical protein